jgi:membrane-associated phospholipid phosphatase
MNNPRRSAARLTTDVLAPGNLLIGLLVVVGWHGSGGLRGIAWGLTAAAVCAGLPLGIVLLGVRRGHWTDIHVRVREQRFVPIAVAMAANLAGVALLAACGAPRPLIALVLAVICALVAGLVVTVRWKISGHTMAAGFTALVLTALWGPWLLLAFLAVPLTGWSRVVLGDHDRAQVICGALLGTAVALLVFVPLN